MPTWANNPDYTVHATTTKRDDTQRIPVFNVFPTNSDTKSDDPSPTKGERRDSITRL